MKKCAFLWILSLMLCMTYTASADWNCQLIYNGGSANDVTVAWNHAEQALSVSYTETYDWFALNDFNEAQGTRLFKKGASDSYEIVEGVAGRIVRASDDRSSSNDYGTITLQFFTGDALYPFAPGAEYAVQLDIVANGYHHTSPDGELIPLGVVTAARPADASANSGIVGKWLSEQQPDGMHAYLEYRPDCTFLLNSVFYNSQFVGTPRNWGDGNWSVHEGMTGTYVVNDGKLTLTADFGEAVLLSARTEGNRLFILDEYGDEIAFDPLGRYDSAPAAAQASAVSAYDAYPILWSNGNTDAVYAAIPEYDALFSFDEPTTVACLTTYHWNGGFGAEPGSIGIFAYDQSTGEQAEVGVWLAVGRSGHLGTPNVYWDIFPNVTLDAGQSYFVNTTDDNTWSWNEGSDGCGFVEIRGYAGGAQQAPVIFVPTTPPSPFSVATALPMPSPVIVSPEPFDMTGQWADASSWAGIWDTTFEQMTLQQNGSAVTGSYAYDGGVIEGTVSGNTLTGTWTEHETQVGRFVFTLSPDGNSFTGTYGYGDESTGGEWIGTRTGGADGSNVLAEQIVGEWLSITASESGQGYLELRADGTFTLTMVSHDPQSEGTPENWGDGMWTMSEFASGVYAVRGGELALLTDGDDGSTLSIRMEGNRMYTVDEYDEEIVFVSVGGAQPAPADLLPSASPPTLETSASPDMATPAVRGGSPFATPKPEPTAAVLWTNDNSSAIQNSARDYYVIFDLPDCTVTELETRHDSGGGKAPGTLILYGEDGSEYGPFQAEGREGPDGAPNARWIANVNLELSAGRYALEDSDPQTWSSNGETEGWGMATVRGMPKKQTGNPFGGGRTDETGGEPSNPGVSPPADVGNSAPSGGGSGVRPQSDLALDFGWGNYADSVAVTAEPATSETAGGLLSNLYAMTFEQYTADPVTVTFPLPENYTRGKPEDSAVMLGIGREYAVESGAVERIFIYHEATVTGNTATVRFTPADFGGNEAALGAAGRAVPVSAGKLKLYLGYFAKNSTYFENGHFRVWFDWKLKFPEETRAAVLGDLESVYQYYANLGYNCPSGMMDIYLEPGLYEEGYYLWLLDEIQLRASDFSPNYNPEYILPIIKHEYFHAIQNNYVTWAGLSNWFGEATASYYEARHRNVTATSLTGEYFHLIFESALPISNTDNAGYARVPLTAYISKRLGNDVWIRERLQNGMSDEDIQKIMTGISPNFNTDYYTALALGEIGDDSFYSLYNGIHDIQMSYAVGSVLFLAVPEKSEMEALQAKGERVLLGTRTLSISGTGARLVALNDILEGGERLPDNAGITLKCEGGVLRVIRAKANNVALCDATIPNIKQSLNDKEKYMALIYVDGPAGSVKDVTVTAELATDEFAGEYKSDLVFHTPTDLSGLMGMSMGDTVSNIRLTINRDATVSAYYYARAGYSLSLYGSNITVSSVTQGEAMNRVMKPSGSGYDISLRFEATTSAEGDYGGAAYDNTSGAYESTEKTTVQIDAKAKRTVTNGVAEYVITGTVSLTTNGTTFTSNVFTCKREL